MKKSLFYLLAVLILTPNIYAEGMTPEEAFPGSLVAGERVWDQMDVVEVTVETRITGEDVNIWKGACSLQNGLLSGQYPDVKFKMGRLDCLGDAPTDISKLNVIGRGISYKARHIPAYPSAPHQFAFSYNGMNSDRIFGRNWVRRESLNALTRKDVVFLDFMGTARRSSSRTNLDDIIYFMMVTITPNEDQTEKMRVELSINDYSNQKEVNVFFETELK